MFKIYYTFASVINFGRYLMLSDLAKARYLCNEVQRREGTPAATRLQAELQQVRKKLDLRSSGRRSQVNWAELVLQEAERLEEARNPQPIRDETW